MALKQSLRVAEFSQYLVVGHGWAFARFVVGIGEARNPRNQREKSANAALEGLECPPYKAATFVTASMAARNPRR